MRDYRLTYEQGQQVAEVLRRYVNEELEPRTEIGSVYFVDFENAREIQKDINYINGLVKLFEE